jgi:hypothetical protein
METLPGSATALALALAAAAPAGAEVNVQPGVGLGISRITSTYYPPSLLFPGYSLPPVWIPQGYFSDQLIAPFPVPPLITRTLPPFFTIPLRKASAAAPLPAPASPPPAPPSASVPSRERSASPGSGGFYLENQAGRPAEGIGTLVRQQLRVEKSDGDQYLVRWAGAAEDTRSAEFQSVDAAGQVLHSRVLKEAPFRGPLHVPAETAAIVVIVEGRAGAGATFRLPVAEFKTLDSGGR